MTHLVVPNVTLKVFDTTEGSDHRRKLGQPTDGKDIVFGSWTDEGNLVSMMHW